MSRPRHVEKLRRRIDIGSDGRRSLLTVPGCWDGLSALLVEQAGAEAAFVTGGGLSMARLGRPDTGLVTATETIDAVMMIRDRVEIPLIVDVDTGFGGAANVQRTLRLVERAGASAIQIEDQVFPKICGHMSGKALAPMLEAVDRVNAALDARHEMLVIARTDAVAVEGLDSALERAEAFLEAGADLIFVEGPPTRAATERVAARLAARAPLVHNLVEGGVSSTEDGRELERLGFAVALHPLMLMHGLVKLAPDLLARLLAEKGTSGFRDRLVDIQAMNRLLAASA